MRSYLTGWRAYFRLADTPGIFADVDQWLHRRLRMLMLRQWKCGRTMYRELQRRGVDGAALGVAAPFGRSWWHVAAHKALHIALPVRTSSPSVFRDLRTNLNPPNRRMRTRTSGGVGGK